MAKVAYLELVEMLSEHVKGETKERLNYVIERKKQLKEEDTDLDGVLDDILRGIRGESK